MTVDKRPCPICNEWSHAACAAVIWSNGRKAGAKYRKCLERVRALLTDGELDIALQEAERGLGLTSPCASVESKEKP